MLRHGGFSPEDPGLLPTYFCSEKREFTLIAFLVTISLAILLVVGALISGRIRCFPLSSESRYPSSALFDKYCNSVNNSVY
jgi:hypothetical protein